jgi:uncharacterized protein YkwD
MRRRGDGGRTQRTAVALVAALVLAGPADPARARPGLLAAMNDIRARGCEGARGGGVPLEASARLDAVAARLVRGDSLEDALEATGHRATRATFFHMGGAVDDVAVARTIARDACAHLLDPGFRLVGVARSGQEVWIVLATLPATDALADVERVRREVVERANTARARSRRCGSRAVGPAGPLRVSTALERAARLHARDMAARGAAAHTGSDGSQPGDRVTRTGYRWRLVGENVAAGQTSAEQVVRDWLASPGHCENLMDPRFRETGVAFVVDTASVSAVYWVQVFAVARAE